MYIVDDKRSGKSNPWHRAKDRNSPSNLQRGSFIKSRVMVHNMYASLTNYNLLLHFVLQPVKLHSEY